MNYRIAFEGSIVITDCKDEDDAINAFDDLIIGIDDMLGVGDGCLEYRQLHFNPKSISRIESNGVE